MRSNPNSPCTSTTGSGGPRPLAPAFVSTPSSGATALAAFCRRMTTTTAATSSATSSATIKIVSTADASVTHSPRMRVALFAVCALAACFHSSPGDPLSNRTHGAADRDGDGLHDNVDKCPDDPEDF